MALAQQQLVIGYVKNVVADKGLFVYLNRTVVAHVRIGDLSDGFISRDKLDKVFPPGKLVIGMLLTN